jgi:hypothetical protein
MSSVNRAASTYAAAEKTQMANAGNMPEEINAD